MKKELGTFKRTTRKDFKNNFYVIIKAFVGVFVIYLLYIAGALIRYYNGLEVPKEETINAEITIICVLIFLVICGIGGIILIAVMPPDFEYRIMLDSGFIIFCSSNNIPKVIKQSFKVSKKTLHYLVLKDKNIKIKIPYNQKVWKVLKEIQN